MPGFDIEQPDDKAVRLQQATDMTVQRFKNFFSLQISGDLLANLSQAFKRCRGLALRLGFRLRVLQPDPRGDMRRVLLR